VRVGAVALGRRRDRAEDVVAVEGALGREPIGQRDGRAAERDARLDDVARDRVALDLARAPLEVGELLGGQVGQALARDTAGGRREAPPRASGGEAGTDAAQEGHHRMSTGPGWAGAGLPRAGGGEVASRGSLALPAPRRDYWRVSRS
jgi:hypothetical protein